MINPGSYKAFNLSDTPPKYFVSNRGHVDGCVLATSEPKPVNKWTLIRRRENRDHGKVQIQ
jgi:hypothetical protein